MSSLSPAPSRQPDLECGPATQQRGPISTTPVTIFLLPLPNRQPAKSMSSSVCKQQTSLACTSRTLIPNGRKAHDALPGSPFPAASSCSRTCRLGSQPAVARKMEARGSCKKRSDNPGQRCSRPHFASADPGRPRTAGSALLSHIEGGEAFFLAPAPIFHPVWLGEWL